MSTLATRAPRRVTSALPWGGRASNIKTKRRGRQPKRSRRLCGARKLFGPLCSRLYDTARMNLERRGSSSASCGLDGCVALPATTVSVEKARRASETLIVPSAEERRPEKGSSSGERPHCVFRLTRPTAVASTSTRGAAAAAERVKMAACWP